MPAGARRRCGAVRADLSCSRPSATTSWPPSLAYLCATAGLTVLIGLTGQLSLGHGALMAIGAYTCALIARPSWATVVRRGRRCSLVPLAGAVVVTSLVGRGHRARRGPPERPLPRRADPGSDDRRAGDHDHLRRPARRRPGPLGLRRARPARARRDLPARAWQAWIALGGRPAHHVPAREPDPRPLRPAMRAVRDDEVAARLAGIDVARTKVLAFVVSAAPAGLGGALLAVLDPERSHPAPSRSTLSLFLVAGRRHRRARPPGRSGVGGVAARRAPRAHRLPGRRPPGLGRAGRSGSTATSRWPSSASS